jgi:hypothetical protein
MQFRNRLVWLLGIALLTVAGSTFAQAQSTRWSGIADDQSRPTRTSPPVGALRPSKTKEVDTAQITKINAWTVGLAAGQLEGAPLQFATDVSRVVLPIVTRGPTENVEALLYLK